MKSNKFFISILFAFPTHLISDSNTIDHLRVGLSKFMVNQIFIIVMSGAAQWTIVSFWNCLEFVNRFYVISFIGLLDCGRIFMDFCLIFSPRIDQKFDLLLPP
jgi:hypothetical protein